MGFGEHVSVGINDLSSWFIDYKIEDIELSIEGMIESGGTRKLVVGNNGGLKVRLKPKGKDELPTGGEISRRQSNKKIELLFPKLEAKEESMASV